MKKSKLTMLAAVAALGGLLVVGGTLAWFTDTETATNVVTMGNINVTLTETDGVLSGDNYGIVYTGVMPGDILAKDPTVTNEGNNNAYIRVQFDAEAVEGATLSAEQEAALDALIATIKVNDKFTALNGWYYYEGELKPNEAVTVFESIEVPGDEWKNFMQNVSFEIPVTVEAVQVDNLLNGDFSVEKLAEAWTFTPEHVE